MQIFLGFLWKYIHYYTFFFVKIVDGQLLASLHFIYNFFSEKLKAVEEVNLAADIKEEYARNFL